MSTVTLYNGEVLTIELFDFGWSFIGDENDEATLFGPDFVASISIGDDTLTISNDINNIEFNLTDSSETSYTFIDNKNVQYTLSLESASKTGDIYNWTCNIAYATNYTEENENQSNYMPQAWRTLVGKPLDDQNISDNPKVWDRFNADYQAWLKLKNLVNLGMISIYDLPNPPKIEDYTDLDSTDSNAGSLVDGIDDWWERRI